MKARRLVAGLAIFLHVSFVARAQLTREANTTLKFPAVLTTAPGAYELKDLLPGITFDRPVCIATPPGENNRLFVVERVGRIIVINDLNNPVKEVFMDMTGQVNAADWVANRRTEGLSSIAFHPNFAANHRFFVTYNTVVNTSQGNGHHNRVSEFRATDDNRRGILSSEIPYITQYDEGDGHNINDLHFGPDGFLYIATGDEGDGGTGDDFNNAQRIDKDFFSAIMRIDVDDRAGSLTPNAHPAANRSAYKIPADNPFVGATSFNGVGVDPAKVRTEFFAVGLRNPWRFSFDPQTGVIYEGDVGQHFREEVNVIVKGGNYGWSYREGATGNGPKAPPGGFSSTGPIYEYGTGFGSDQGFSVTGGVVYRGSAIPALVGNLVFADYVSGNVWAMNIDQLPYQKPVRLLGETGIASFGYDPRNGEILAVNHDRGKIERLQYSSGGPLAIPESLDKTGIFADLAALRVNPGIYGYDVNVPLWSDSATKKRWFSIPSGRKIRFEPAANWLFPTGSVWIKHFEIETRQGDPSSSIRLETRVLVKTESSVYGLSYKWDASGSNAYLVGEGGDSRGLLITEGGVTRRQSWRFPSRSECLSCHTEVSGRILGFTTAQMNRNFTYGSVTTNQLLALSKEFLENGPANLALLHGAAAVNDASASRTYRVKSYLAANCAFCHQPGSSTYAAWDGRITTPLSQAGIIMGTLLNSAGPGTKVIKPGDTNLSSILIRMNSFGADRMPPLASSVLDKEAIRLISDWVTQDLLSYETYEAWAARTIGSGPNSGREADPDGDAISNYTEFLMASDPLKPSSPASMEMIGLNQGKLLFAQPANRGFIVHEKDDFPGTGWRLLDDSQNKLSFPAASADRTFPIPFSGQRRHFRISVFEP